MPSTDHTSQDQLSHTDILTQEPRKVDTQEDPLPHKPESASEPPTMTIERLQVNEQSLRRVTIEDMPMEILVKIFSYIREYSDNETFRTAFRVAATRTLQRARLTCRLFYTLATPLLIPRLHIAIDKESVDRADSITWNPIMASGIREVRVGLAYRPESMARSVEVFRDVHTQYVENIKSELEDGYGRLAGNSPEGLAAVLHACQSAFGQKYDPSDKFQRIFREGYVTFQDKQEEERLFIQSGDFVTLVTAAVARLPQALSLVFEDRTCVEFGRPLLENIVRLTDEDTLRRVATGPVNWEMAEWAYDNIPSVFLADEHPPNDVPATLLYDLLVSLGQSGVELRALQLNCFPRAHNYLMLGGRATFSDGATRSDLEALRHACRHLRLLYFGFSRNRWLWVPQDDVESPPPPSQSRPELEFLSAVLSSPDLEDVALDLDVLCKRDDGTDGSIPMWHTADASLDAVLQSRHSIRRLELSSFAVKEDTLNRFLRRVVGPELRELDLHNIYISSGSWAPARSIIVGHFTEGRGLVVRNLSGGEFGMWGISYLDPTQAFLSDRWADEEEV